MYKNTDFARMGTFYQNDYAEINEKLLEDYNDLKVE